MSQSIEYGQNIRRVRTSQGISMEKVALEAGISVTRMQQIENGSANVTIDTLLRISKALGVRAQVLGFMSLTDEEVNAYLLRAGQAAYQGTKRVHIGERIVQLRKEQGLTQAALARKSRVSVAWLRDIEHGCANATVKLLDRISRALGETLLTLSILTVSENEILRMLHEARAITGKKAA